PGGRCGNARAVDALRAAAGVPRGAGFYFTTLFSISRKKPLFYGHSMGETRSPASRAAARAPPAAKRPPRRRAWLRIFVVGCSLPYDPSGWGSFMQWRDYTTLPSRGLWLLWYGTRYGPRSVGEAAWRRQFPGTMSSHSGCTPSYPRVVTVARACKN